MVSVSFLRGFADDVTDTVSLKRQTKSREVELTKLLQKVEEVRGKQLLTRFQQQKFRHFFYHVLDLNSDHVISQVFMVVVMLLILRTNNGTNSGC